MGTNYYWMDQHKNKTHIGKSSAGWVFALHIYPGDDINDLSDWLRFWDGQEGWIEDEYGDKVEVPMMVRIISGPKETREHNSPPTFYSSWDSFHRENHSEIGPYGLIRSRINSRCIKHGAGPWDCHIGDFC